MQEATTNPIVKIDLAVETEKIKSGLERLSEVEVQRDEFKKQSAEISIADENDKEGYKKTTAFLSVVRKTRVELDRERKIATEPFRGLVKLVNDKYGSVIDSLEEIESGHKKQKEEFDEAIEVKKEKEALEKQRLIDSKINELVIAGLEYDPINSLYKNDRGINVSVTDIINMGEEDFERLKERAMQRKQELVEEELQAKLRAEILDSRKQKLVSIGAQFDGVIYLITSLENNDALTSLSLDELTNISDHAFDLILDNFSVAVATNNKYRNDLIEAKKALDEQKRQQEEAAQKQASEAAQIKKDKLKIAGDKLQAAGFKYNYGQETFTLAGSEEGYFVSVNDILTNTDAVESALKEAELVKKLKEQKEADDIKRIAAEQEAKDKQIADQEQQRKETEAKNKTAAKKDFISAENLIKRTQDAIQKAREEQYAVLAPYINELTDGIENAINIFNEQTKHLK